MLEVPTGIFYLPLPIGGFLMAAAFLFAAVKAGIGQTERSAPTALSPIDAKD